MSCFLFQSNNEYLLFIEEIWHNTEQKSFFFPSHFHVKSLSKGFSCILCVFVIVLTLFFSNFHVVYQSHFTTRHIEKNMFFRWHLLLSAWLTENCSLPSYGVVFHQYLKSACSFSCEVSLISFKQWKHIECSSGQAHLGSLICSITLSLLVVNKVKLTAYFNIKSHNRFVQ